MIAASGARGCLLRMQDDAGLPRMVVLDLTGATLDIDEPLAALAVAAADSPGSDLPPAGAAGQHGDAALDGERWLLCLGGDNRCALANDLGRAAVSAHTETDTDQWLLCMSSIGLCSVYAEN